METINYKYADFEDLSEFIEYNSFALNENILVQIFTGICQVDFINKLLLNIKTSIPNVKIIGTTTCGEIINDTICEFSTIISFTIFENTEIVTHTQELTSNSYQDAKNLIAQFNTTRKAKVAISFVDGINTNGELYLNAFNEYDSDIIVSGGLAGDNSAFNQTIVFNENNILTSGCVVALLYNDDLIAYTKAKFGWKSIGKTMKISKVKENIVYEIDGIKAVEIYSKYLGEDIASELPKTGIEFPLIVNKNGFHIPRAVVSKNSDGSLTFAGNLNLGSEVTFGYGNSEAIVNSGNKLYTQIVKNPVESIFIYSSMARKALLGENIALELKELNFISSLSGFFAYGEFYYNHENSSNELLNQTMTILCLSESNTKPTILINDINKVEYNQGRNKTLKALSHLISQTTKELEEKNTLLSSEVEAEIEKNIYKDRLLLQKSRLAQMGEMLSMIAHQWRQPLSAISATSASLELKARLEKVDYETIISQTRNISKYSRYLSSTINDFSDFFKTTKKKELVSYTEIIDTVISIVEASMKNKNISIIQDLNTQVKFETYASEIKHVLLNLIKNAEDIIVENNTQEAFIKISTFTQNNEHILEVSDNGGGVPEKIIEKIFDPYFSTKENQNGTGLGLYMSKTIIKEHCGGELSVSNNDFGAVFRIRIIS